MWKEFLLNVLAGDSWNWSGGRGRSVEREMRKLFFLFDFLHVKKFDLALSINFHMILLSFSFFFSGWSLAKLRDVLFSLNACVILPRVWLGFGLGWQRVGFLDWSFRNIVDFIFANVTNYYICMTIYYSLVKQLY